MIFGGAGGQGLMLLGKLTAQAAMEEGLKTTWFPSYGAEVRGGTAHCHVIVSDREIYSPLVEEATSLIVMNTPSLKRFSERLASGGILVMNSSLADVPSLPDADVVAVPATDIANELGNIRVANMAMLGALNARAKIVSDEALTSALSKFLAGKGPKVLEMNMEAYRKGSDIGSS